ncbi:AbrB family transcriptional regulator [Staphylococcus caprae]|uniref:AbrB family transcriptional regulator n=1 Tax=Staphylococcus caprae TaxID=29380 RepID=UPI001C83A2F8|nr:AbrB family transcriptional regulator [Staphylococcus caprae]MBX5318448.1 AbrB family transcriptional regulator [Staphylococcus caprae]MDI9230349.1 AbrB family transcriptional regulator [Staphylococcus caprae]
MNKIQRNNFIVLALAIILSLILKFSHILLPFMFGPMIAAILCVKVFKLEIKWPFWLSQTGLIFLGIQIGSTFTKTVIGDIRNDWLTIIIITVLLLVLALFIAYFFKKIAQVNTETAILSVIPGALSQMLIMAEEDKRANILVVSLTQTSRIIFVVILVPLISYFFRDSSSSSEGASMKVAPFTQALEIWQIALILLLVAIVYILMAKINFPTKQLLAPILVLIVWNMTTNLTFTLDHWLLASVQVVYMIRIGIQIAYLLNDLKGRIAVAIAFQNIMLILSAFIMVVIVHVFTNNSINELFLGAAPGGMSQIVLVAMATGADVAMISSYHIFRIFFILFVIAPLIGYFLKYRARYNEK